MFNNARSDRWVFGDRDSGAYLTKMAWTKIVRHQMVDGFASPDDPSLTDYWAARKRRRKPPIDRWGLIQLERQHGRCPLCDQLLLHADHEPQSPEEWERWITVVRTAIRRQAITADQQPARPNGPGASRLVHTLCARKSTRRIGRSATPATPVGLLEPDAGTTRTSGSEGAPARQRAGATRPCVAPEPDDRRITGAPLGVEVI